jgi:TRAP-type C4-dicarboxylate transport system substrate-binding protein
VNRLGKGKVQIQYLGAEDVLPPFDQPEALVNGVFDVWYGAPNYWQGVVPGGDVTELSPLKIPDGGPGHEIYEFLVDLFEAKGVRYLAHAAGDLGVGTHYLNTKFPAKSIDDLKGKKLRVSPLLRHFVQAVDGEPVTLPPSEIYLAMDRGTVDGFSWPVADAFTRYGWQEVTDYMIDQPMYRSGGGLAMNLDKWNSLSPEVQEILLQAVRETQEFSIGWFAQNQDEQVRLMKEGGVELIDISDEEATRWNEAANEALWAYYGTVYDPEQIKHIQAMFAGKQ